MSDKPRILAVDDEPHITLVLRSGLLAAGYDVRTANEGESALDLFHSWKPSLVICDVSMPGLTGIEFVSQDTLSFIGSDHRSFC
ncbi:MAG TPA: response regulator [Terriglobales bacterium]|nr:response regulator [Terriglobales bacterium]